MGKQSFQKAYVGSGSDGRKSDGLSVKMLLQTAVEANWPAIPELLRRIEEKKLAVAAGKAPQSELDDLQKE